MTSYKKNKHIIVVLAICLSCLYSCSEQKKQRQTVLNLQIDSVSSGEITIYPYQAVSSRKEADSLTIVRHIDDTISSILIDSSKVLRRVAINLNGQRYGTQIFTGPGENGIIILDGKIEAKETALQQEFIHLDSILGFSHMSKIQYKKEVSKEDSIFKVNFGTSLLTAIKKYPKSYPLLHMVRSQFWNADLDVLDQIIEGFDPSMRDNYNLKTLIERRNSLNLTEIGEPAPDFTLTNIEGKKVSLNEYRGKYVLIDFWAYWCIPCIATFPKLKEIREMYPEDTLVLLSISTDRNYDKWVAAVEKHKLPWPQLIDDDTDVSNTYAVTAIPHLLLVSPEGTILYKYDHKGQLDKKLKEFIVP